MNTLSSYLTYFFEKVKSQLCDRRNERDRVRLNRFAQLERTDVLVRKSREEGSVGGGKGGVGLKKRDGKSRDRSIGNKDGNPKSQPNPNNTSNSNHHHPTTLTHPKPSTYKLSLT